MGFDGAVWWQTLGMRSLLALIGVGAGALAIGALPATGGLAVAQPALGLVSSSPVTVHGLHFKARKLVRVTFRAGDTVSVGTVRTSTVGAFTLPAPDGFAYDRCSASLQISAAGVISSTGAAAIRIPPRECAPLSTP